MIAGVYDVQATLPSHGTAGLITPANNNGAWSVLRNVVVTGFATCIVCNEHTDADSLVYHHSQLALAGEPGNASAHVLLYWTKQRCVPVPHAH